MIVLAYSTHFKHFTYMRILTRLIRFQIRKNPAYHRTGSIDVEAKVEIQSKVFFI